MKVSLTFVKNEEKTSKAGKKYTSCSLKTKEHGDTWLSGFGNVQTKGWMTGDTVSIEVYEETYNGKTYLKFKTLSREDMLEERIKRCEERIHRLENPDPRITQSSDDGCLTSKSEPSEDDGLPL